MYRLLLIIFDLWGDDWFGGGGGINVCVTGPQALSFLFDLGINHHCSSINSWCSSCKGCSKQCIVKRVER